MGEGSASRPGSTLPPGKTWYPLYRRLGGPQGRSGQVRKISPQPGFDPQTVQPVGSRYTDWATRPTLMQWNCVNTKIVHLLVKCYRLLQNVSYCLPVDTSSHPIVTISFLTPVVKTSSDLLYLLHLSVGNINKNPNAVAPMVLGPYIAHWMLKWHNPQIARLELILRLS